MPLESPWLRATWFDGRSSRARPVRVRLVPAAGGPGLQWQPEDDPDGPALQRTHAEVAWPERFSLKRPPRQVTIDLHEQGSLALDDPAAWQQAFESAGARLPFAERMQTRWPVFAGMFVAAFVLVAIFYRWGTPWAASRIARHVPLAWEQQLSRKALEDMDRAVFEPSALPPSRQDALRAQFASLAAQLAPELRRYPDYAPAVQLHFRKGLGANAFALPGGTVVVTDGLVEAADAEKLPDDAVLGVLAHEIGHVVHRHTTRMVVEQGVLNIGLGLALGDTSWAFSNASSLLTTLAYQRSHEAEADCFASRLMRRAGRPLQPMGRLLLHLDPHTDGAAEFISSHPATPERARRLAEGGSGCEGD
ncbi:M48 family metallopeptidase [Ramlibacter pallidus]|uniref:M48 family metallopeptidase n=1 Tax=Ramlibacter pallidus TaxID=2780087 RepID=A0ABR9RY47_9BURK|nr:M48 family metallopeptidase [Ramlibacter pallidus]MBE7366150.1 M48 family metallopeptidase [Ramlibacter pallidus]